jgi:hypothetical protein
MGNLAFQVRVLRDRSIERNQLKIGRDREGGTLLPGMMDVRLNVEGEPSINVGQVHLPHP